MNFSLLTPPKPPATSKQQGSDQNTNGSRNSYSSTKDATATFLGRSLTSKLSELQKADDATINDATNKLLSTLSEIRMIISRRGLLRGDLIRAEAFLSNISEAGGNNSAGGGGGGGGGKRRKKGGGGGGSSGKAFNFVDGSPSTVGHGIADDEGLLLIALGRILGAGKAVKNNESTLPDVIVQEASEVLLVICRHVTTYMSSASLCCSAEYELLLPACPQLLNGLGTTATNLLRNIQSDASASTTDALASCHRAVASIIVLMCTRLSRTTATTDKIASTASEALFLRSDNTKHCIKSAAALLAAQPLAGNSDGVSPAKLWTDAVLQATKSLTLVLSIFFPIHRSASKARQYVDANDQAWVDLVEQSLNTQDDRTNEFMRRIEGYSAVLSSLLDMEGCDGSRAERFFACASVPLGGILDLVELMLAFPSAAEACYLSTKSRLRDESIQNGMLSPNSAMVVANEVKYCGLGLFDRVLSSTTSSSLVQGGRILRMAFNSLQSSCSYALRRSIDPVGTPALRADVKRGRRWLHDSLRLRSMSVKAFGRAILRTGPSAASASEGGSLVAKGLIFISGCLLEQTNAHDANPEADWGTLSDRIDLASACADALGIALSVTGPYLESNTRSTIESVTATCLSALAASDSVPGPALSYSSTICSLLRLASKCICAPWSDGAASNLTGLLRNTAEALKGDKDNEVSSAAYSALCMYNAIMAPRSPPLAVITRGTDGASGMGNVQRGRSGLSFLSSDILEGIQAAKKEVQAAVAPSSGEKRKTDSAGVDDAPSRISNEAQRVEKRQKQDKGSSGNSNYAIDVGAEIEGDEIRIEEKPEVAVLPMVERQKVQEKSIRKYMEIESENEEKVSKVQAESEITVERETSHANDGDIDNDDGAPVAKNNAMNHPPKGESDNSDSDMGDFPEIVDVGPDDEDA